MLSAEQIRSIVLMHIRGLTLDDATDFEPFALSDLGLNSLTTARLFIQLEHDLGVDPLSAEGYTLGGLRTVHDLIRCCVDAVRMHKTKLRVEA